jgi:hypothetical protein
MRLVARDIIYNRVFSGDDRYLVRILCNDYLPVRGCMNLELTRHSWNTNNVNHISMILISRDTPENSH